MPGTVNTIPLWRRRKPNRVERERALKSEALMPERIDSEYGVIEQTIARRRLDLAKAVSEQARHRS